jgi:mannose-1-phosphate guanylyltransferase
VIAELGWSDTGKWFLAQEILRKHPGANVTAGRVVVADSSDSLVYAPAGKIAVLVGLKGVIVVDTGDALLVCAKERSGDVKHVVERLQQMGLRTVL